MGESVDEHAGARRCVAAGALIVGGGAVCAVALVSLTMIGNAAADWGTVAFVSVYAVPIGVILAVIAAAAGRAVRDRASARVRLTPLQQGALTVAVIAFVGTLLAGLLVAVAYPLVIVAAVVFASFSALLASLVLRFPRRW